MPEDIDYGRRRLLEKAAITIAAAELVLLGRPKAQTTKDSDANVPSAGQGAKRSFGPIKQVDAGLLNVGYAETGPSNGRAVILLHGWPYDIHSYVDVAPLLASAGYRVIVPYLRGFGTTRFLSSETFRNAQQSVVALDIIALMDALHIEKAILGGFDWGSRTAAIMAALWPERCAALVAVSGYLITNLKANLEPLPPKAELGWWYQYYFATERGRLGYNDNRYDQLEQKLFEAPVISVPTITLASDFDGAAADGAAYAKKFSGKYAHRVLNGVGHNVPQEAPEAFAEAVREVDRRNLAAGGIRP
jgi:pimeloyl-ACP methyl ester carboxylesterase